MMRLMGRPSNQSKIGITGSFIRNEGSAVIWRYLALLGDDARGAGVGHIPLSVTQIAAFDGGKTRR
jgi:hypothetical protein